MTNLFQKYLPESIQEHLLNMLGPADVEDLDAYLLSLALSLDSYTRFGILEISTAADLLVAKVANYEIVQTDSFLCEGLILALCECPLCPDSVEKLSP